MPRDLWLTRLEAEFLTDVTPLINHLNKVDERIRKLWGMCSREEELAKDGITIEQYRLNFAKRILEKSKAEPTENQNDPRTDAGRVQYLERIAECADGLEKFLAENVGDTLDWPVRIQADDDSHHNLVTKLNDLSNALMPYRKEP